MKAVIQDRYGPPEALQLKEIDKPEATDDEVLVRIRAASLHPDVWHVVTGRPYVLRVMGSGLFKPKNPVPGIDMAGRVEAVGASVERFGPGDDVFGEIVKGHQWKNAGAFAEYVAVPADALVAKPPNLSFEEAAAVPTSGILAYENVHGHIQPGDKVLINGAAGGVGMFAVQVAKSEGAEVTAVDSTEKTAMLRSIGADHVIDYSAEDFTGTGEQYDFVLDIPGNRSFDDLKRIVAPEGSYVYIGHDGFGRDGGRWIGSGIPRFMKMEMTRPFGSQQTAPRSEEEGVPLEILSRLLASGSMTAVIDRTYPLDEVPEALRYLEGGRVQGKIVIVV